jgi:hypothetical protein
MVLAQMPDADHAYVDGLHVCAAFFLPKRNRQARMNDDERSRRSRGMRRARDREARRTMSVAFALNGLVRRD